MKKCFLAFLVLFAFGCMERAEWEFRVGQQVMVKATDEVVMVLGCEWRSYSTWNRGTRQYLCRVYRDATDKDNRVIPYATVWFSEWELVQRENKR